jgi:acyl-CoA reductase-like NAD-dependent aldehyde dehydrogenase
MSVMKIINPANEGLIIELNEDSGDSLKTKFNVIKKALPAWQSTSLEKRIDILRRFLSVLELHEETSAALLTSEVGKPLQQSRNEIRGARSRIKWLTDNASRYLSDEVMTVEDGLEERIVYEPLGIVCNISAWNYPYLVGVNVFVPALLGGNGVMYKPSEFATLTGLQIGKMLVEAGVPEEIFQIATGGRSTGEQLLDMPFDGFFFTGSYHTGKYIYERVSSRMVPCQCELGGKDPLYVADDIKDIPSVAAATADGAFYNNGQSCCAVERIYIHEKVYDQYVEEFVREVKRWKIGEPTEEGVYIGPLTRKDQLTLLANHVDDAVRNGASILAGGRPVTRKGYFFEPTVLTNVNNSMKVMREESFGPIIGIMKVKDDQEAINLMNDTDYGLTASVYSSDPERARKILSGINAGTGYWNCCDRVSAALPWSGRKNSGIGSTLSHAGLRAFVRSKAYHLKS